MRSADWVALLRRIPSDQYDTLLIVTSNGTEIAIQAILRIDEEFLVIRGRMSGTDIVRTLFVPYESMSYLGFMKAVKEAQVRAMFGEPEPLARQANAEQDPSGPPSEAAAAVNGEAGESAAPTDAAKTNDPAKPAVVPPPADKKTMLERLRSRSFVGTTKSPLR